MFSTLNRGGDPILAPGNAVPAETRGRYEIADWFDAMPIYRLHRLGIPHEVAVVKLTMSTWVILIPKGCCFRRGPWPREESYSHMVDHDMLECLLDFAVLFWRVA